MSRAKYIADQYAQIDSLLERMRQADIQSNPTPQSDVQDVIEKDPGKGAFNPAYPNKVDVARAYTEQLAMVNATNPEAYARGVGKNAPPPVFEEKGADIHPGRPRQQNVNRRGPVNANQVQIEKPVEELPGHMLYGANGQIVENATKQLEQLGQSSQNAPTRIKGGSSGDVPAEQQYFDATDEQVAESMVDAHGREHTNVDFAYVDGEGAYDKYLEKYAGDAEVQAGAGKEISDDAYGVTVTYAVDNPTKKA